MKKIFLSTIFALFLGMSMTATADLYQPKNVDVLHFQTKWLKEELNLNKNEWYHLGYYIKANKNGTSYIGVTTTKPDSNADFSNPEKLDITAFYPNANSVWNRDGFKFFSMPSGVVYIVVYGGTNSIQIDDLNLYKDVHSYETNPNNPKLLPEYDYDGDGILYDKYDAMFDAMYKN